jgi:hypothetical protein
MNPSIELFELDYQAAMIKMALEYRPFLASEIASERCRYPNCDLINCECGALTRPQCATPSAPDASTHAQRLPE